MDALFVGVATEVELKFMSEIHHWGRGTYISTRSAFVDVKAEIWTESAETVESEQSNVGAGSFTTTSNLEQVDRYGSNETEEGVSENG